MTKGTIAIREVKSDQKMLSLEDYNVRLNAKKFATEYLEEKEKEKEEKTRWMYYAGYFFLGCFFWECIPLFTELVRNLIKF